MFFEEWELLTEPMLLQPLPMVALSGIATQEDAFVEARAKIDEEFEKRYVQHYSEELLDDIVGAVRTPTPPPPNMRDPETFKQFFEEKNKHLGLYFTKYSMDAFYELLEDV